MRMKRVVLGLVGVAGVGLLTVAPTQAHHAFASEFDANRPIKVQGTIVRVQWTNPHTWFHVDVKNENGQVERWMFEGGGPAALIRRGFTKDFIKPGSEVSVQGYLAKGTPRRANARVFTYADGRSLFVGSSGTGEPVDGFDPDAKK
jgi:DNA/RNA endonuclease YhcR with UshA esterase domain